MELHTVHLGTMDRLTICPIGDIQWTGPDGVTAKDKLKRHIERCLAQENPYFIGLGDYIDMASPSNRKAVQEGGFYDTFIELMQGKAVELVNELYESYLRDTKKRWLGLVHGHHWFMTKDGDTSDQYLATLLETQFLGTSCFIRIEPIGKTIWMHHGLGSGVLPAPGLNKLYHVSAGLSGADVYLIGHNTKLASARLSRPMPIWQQDPVMTDKDILLVNTGGFSRSNVPGHKVQGRPWACYAEEAMLTPSPLSAPRITIENTKYGPIIEVTI